MKEIVYNKLKGYKISDMTKNEWEQQPSPKPPRAEY